MTDKVYMQILSPYFPICISFLFFIFNFPGVFCQSLYLFVLGLGGGVGGGRDG